MNNKTLSMKYNGMIHRCYTCKEDSKAYKHYRGRGISIHPDWLGENGKENFIQWAISNGYKEGLSIDRIDVNGNYEPSNCRWITMFEQQSNKRNNNFITYNNETKHVSEWSRILGINAETICERISRGWSKEEALSPIEKYPAKLTSDISGVIWNKTRNRWKAMGSKQNSNQFIGWYYTKEKAEYAKLKYEKNKVKIHNKNITDDMLEELKTLKLELENKIINY